MSDKDMTARDWELENARADQFMAHEECARLRFRVAALEAAQFPATITETRERISRLLDHLVELAVGEEVEP